MRVRVGGEIVADTRHAMFLFETGHAARYYLPQADVRMDLLVPTQRGIFGAAADGVHFVHEQHAKHLLIAAQGLRDAQRTVTPKNVGVYAGSTHAQLRRAARPRQPG